jgi:hypothetical protein
VTGIPVLTMTEIRQALRDQDKAGDAGLALAAAPRDETEDGGRAR